MAVKSPLTGPEQGYRIQRQAQLDSLLSIAEPCTFALVDELRQAADQLPG